MCIRIRVSCTEAPSWRSVQTIRSLARKQPLGRRRKVSPNRPHSSSSLHLLSAPLKSLNVLADSPLRSQSGAITHPVNKRMLALLGCLSLCFYQANLAFDCYFYHSDDITCSLLRLRTWWHYLYVLGPQTKSLSFSMGPFRRCTRLSGSILCLILEECGSPCTSAK